MCVVTENGICNLIIPKQNLITEKNNEPIYFGKMADELIRYKRIQTFMFQQQTYISFDNINYNLREDEIILIQSLLTQEYFENLIPMTINKYVKQNSYDEAEPAISQIYDNTITSIEDIPSRNIDECSKPTNSKITSALWKVTFPSNYTETVYGNSTYCTFNFIIDLIEKNTKEKYTINQIKNYLYNEYKKYLPEYSSKIIDILIIEGKKTIGDQVQTGTISFSDFIFMDSYFLTTFDLWLLVDKFKIPTIFISQKYILQTNYERYCFVGYTTENNNTDKYVFIVLPGLRAETIPSLKIIESNTNDVFISISELNSQHTDNIMYAIDNKVTIEDYLNTFVKAKKTIYAKKKPANLVIEYNKEENKGIQIVPKTRTRRKKIEIQNEKQKIEEDLRKEEKEIEKIEDKIKENIEKQIEENIEGKIEDNKEQIEMQIVPKKRTRRKKIEIQKEKEGQTAMQIVPKKKTKKNKIILKGNKKFNLQIIDELTNSK